MKRWIVLGLKLAVIGLLVFWLWRSLKASDLRLEKLEGVWRGWPWLLLAQVFVGAMCIVSFYRWKLLLSAQGIRYTFRETVALGFIGFFFSLFIPGSTGGDLMKAYYVAVDHPERRTAGITTVFLDRVIGLLVLVAIAGASIGLNWPTIMRVPALQALAALVGATLLGTALAGMVFFSSRVRSHPLVRAVLKRLPLSGVITKVQAAVYVYKFHPVLVLNAVILSLVVQLSVVAMVICYALALGGTVELSNFFFLVPLGQLAMAIPIGLPGGLGQSEVAYSELFLLVGYPDGFNLALLQRVNWCLWALIGGVLYVNRRGRVRRALELAVEDEKSGGGLAPDEPAPGRPGAKPVGEPPLQTAEP